MPRNTGSLLYYIRHFHFEIGFARQIRNLILLILIDLSVCRSKQSVSHALNSVENWWNELPRQKNPIYPPVVSENSMRIRNVKWEVVPSDDAMAGASYTEYGDCTYELHSSDKLIFNIFFTSYCSPGLVSATIKLNLWQTQFNYVCK